MGLSTVSQNLNLLEQEGLIAVSYTHLDVYKRQGYGSYNNYIFCEQNGIEKYMKFPMFKKETKDEK